ncbi:uncharacterized protein ARMOST_09811 [Armillaria ostoyae]|uniref:Uncharacterized protein n=1 Tax=Armillaria ostoyae TaxID=47428 RepID=A0A284RCJ1_ARMOS|nr:uncharacterized protein ARMOST_09811 [Armillaria ostoyae]
MDRGLQPRERDWNSLDSITQTPARSQLCFHNHCARTHTSFWPGASHLLLMCRPTVYLSWSSIYKKKRADLLKPLRLTEVHSCSLVISTWHCSPAAARASVTLSPVSPIEFVLFCPSCPQFWGYSLVYQVGVLLFTRESGQLVGSLVALIAGVLSTVPFHESNTRINILTLLNCHRLSLAISTASTLATYVAVRRTEASLIHDAKLCC